MKNDDIDWKNALLKLLKMFGEETNEWHSHLWEAYGITLEEAKAILKEYEDKFPEDASDSDEPSMDEFKI